MSTSLRLLAATRKGLFVLRHDREAGWAIERHVFPGENLTQVLADPRDGRWYAALNLGHFGVKLQVSEDAGVRWSELPVPSYPEGAEQATGDGKPAQPATLKLLWALAAGGADQPGRLWAGTIPGGLFRSDDHGASWSLVQALWDQPSRPRWFGGGYDAPGIHSIAVDRRDSRRLTVAISCGGVWYSADDGSSWAVRTQGMYAVYMPPEQREDPTIQDPHCLVQCSAAPDHLWVQHHNGAFASDDGGLRWRELAVPPSVFGFAVAVHPADPRTAWFVPAVKDECRIPVDGRLVVSRTRDGGHSFEVLTAGLPTEPSYDLVYRHGLAISADAAWLAIGSTSGGVWLSPDLGAHWQALPARLPPVHALHFL